MKEDKIREHELNLHSKDVTKQILQNQVRKSNDKYLRFHKYTKKAKT